MPIKPVDSSEGGCLGRPVGHRNSGEKIEVLVEVLMVVKEVAVQMLEAVVEMMQVINQNSHCHLLVLVYFLIDLIWL